MMNNFVSRANQITLQLPTKVSFNIIAHLSQCGVVILAV